LFVGLGHSILPWSAINHVDVNHRGHVKLLSL
jgi:hypothetical protein